MTLITSPGLDNVIAAETVLSHVDGEAGRLIVRGVDIDDLAGHAGFEDAVALLWRGVVTSDTATGDDLKAGLAAGRVAAFARFAPLAPLVRTLAPVEAMRLFLAAIPDGARSQQPAEMVAAAGVAAALAVRATAGEAPLCPDPNLGHAADVLRMLRASPGDSAEVRAFETYLVTILDHGLNASTFTARVVASTAAGLPSAVVAALGALKGPLHGGAPGPVLDMLDDIRTPDRAEAWMEKALDGGARLMGFGHRIYRVRDPRADVLKKAVATLKGRANRIALAEAVEAAALKVLKARKGERRLDTNVEFYTALLLEALGIPREAFTLVFAAGRVAGWVAHVREQEAGARIIRPQSRYVGPWPAANPGRAA